MSSSAVEAGKTSSAQVRWLDAAPGATSGTTFGLPWPRGTHDPDATRFECSSKDGLRIPLQTWITAYWHDGSIKWTAHAIPASKTTDDEYSVRAIPHDNSPTDNANALGNGLLTVTQNSEDVIEVNTGKIRVSFSTSGTSIIQGISTAAGKTLGINGQLVLLSQSSIPDDYESKQPSKPLLFNGSLDRIVVEQSGPVRAVIAITGKHHLLDSDEQRTPWLPFTLRFYLYANSDTIRLLHTIIYDGDISSDFIRGIGIRFNVPLEGEELFNRHIRISSSHGGVFSEAVQGITGLRRDPGPSVRQAQLDGKPTPPLAEWDPSVSSRLQWVPTWSDYSLTQPSPDGYTFSKRTKAGCSWVKIPHGSRAGGFVYLGGATKGGLGMGLRNFWERYPTGLDIRNATSDSGEVTLWMYSPAAPAMDLRQYHDGLQQDTYDEQLDALNITYEDWEQETGSPVGIARTNEVYIFAFEETPDAQTITNLTEDTRNPPVLVAISEYIYGTQAFGTYWSPFSQVHISNPKVQVIEANLEFLFKFYQSQVSQRKWYGFWDHGDIMHTYDEDRHTWRYDVGGYAWDNSELSPDLWLWLYFLHTGKPEVYRLAEALTRHTGEVDVYHIGRYRGLGTRHGVQHWSDSCKQARISNAAYRKHFYYLSGGDERVGDLLRETLDTEKTFMILDPYRKVRKDRGKYFPDPQQLSINLGTDWSALAAAWIIEFERRGPRWEEARKKLEASMKGISHLANGFVTGTALYNLETGALAPPLQDPTNVGFVQVSHLSAMFGLFEVCAELVDSFPADATLEFERAWLEYCHYYNASEKEQSARFGIAFANLQLRQGHSRLTAYAAWRRKDEGVARRAWHEFYTGDGYGSELPWKSDLVSGAHGLEPVEEAAWVSTNISSLYGLAALQNLALLQKGPDGS